MCNCINVEMGSYGNQFELELPSHMAAYKAKQGGANTICVDACIKDEILELWSLGITTTGCCCGHNKVDGYIGVIEEDIERMKDLGYKVQFNPMRPNDEDGFEPLTFINIPELIELRKLLRSQKTITPTVKSKTVGQLIKEQIKLHELDWKKVAKVLDVSKDTMEMLMNDNIYSNNIPVLLFRNLIASLYIPLSTIIPAMTETFKLLKSKETAEDIKKKPHGYMLWENEESLNKYISHLKDIFQTGSREKLNVEKQNYPLLKHRDSNTRKLDLHKLRKQCNAALTDESVNEYLNKNPLPRVYIKYFIENTNTGEWYFVEVPDTMPLASDISNNWTKDPHEAMAFDSFKEAEQYRTDFKMALDFPHLKVTEHEFISEKRPRQTDEIKRLKALIKLWFNGTDNEWNQYCITNNL